MSFEWQLQKADGSVVEIKKNRFVIGRNPTADISTTQIKISRKHATIFMFPNKELCVTDHKSMFGTFINGSKISFSALREGDILSFGGPPTALTTNPEFKNQFIYRVVKKNLIPPTEPSSRIIDNEYEAITSSEESVALNNPKNDKRTIVTKKSTETSTLKISENNKNIHTEVSTSKDCVDCALCNCARLDLLPPPTIKSGTPSYLTTPSCPALSYRDSFNDCIVISDDEEGINHSLSQIFKISENIKDEPKDESYGFDPYQSIKDELEVKDFLEKQQVVSYVDLTGAMNFENVADLVAVLETESMFGDNDLSIEKSTEEASPVSKALRTMWVSLEYSPEVEENIKLLSKSTGKYVVREPHNEEDESNIETERNNSNVDEAKRRKINDDKERRISIDDFRKQLSIGEKLRKLRTRSKSKDVIRSLSPKSTERKIGDVEKKRRKFEDDKKCSKSTDDFKRPPSTDAFLRKLHRRDQYIDDIRAATPKYPEKPTVEVEIKGQKIDDDKKSRKATDLKKPTDERQSSPIITPQASPKCTDMPILGDEIKRQKLDDDKRIRKAADDFKRQSSTDGALRKLRGRSKSINVTRSASPKCTDRAILDDEIKRQKLDDDKKSCKTSDDFKRQSSTIITRSASPKCTDRSILGDKIKRQKLDDDKRSRKAADDFKRQSSTDGALRKLRGRSKSINVTRSASPKCTDRAILDDEIKRQKLDDDKKSCKTSDDFKRQSSTIITRSASPKCTDRSILGDEIKRQKLDDDKRSRKAADDFKRQSSTDGALRKLRGRSKSVNVTRSASPKYADKPILDEIKRQKLGDDKKRLKSTDDFNRQSSTNGALKIRRGRSKSINVTRLASPKYTNKPILDFEIKRQKLDDDEKNPKDCKRRPFTDVTSRKLRSGSKSIGVTNSVSPKCAESSVVLQDEINRQKLDDSKKIPKSVGDKRRPSTDGTLGNFGSSSTHIEVTAQLNNREIREIRKRKLKELAGTKTATTAEAEQPSISLKTDDLAVMKKPEKLKFSNLQYSADTASASSETSKKEQEFLTNSCIKPRFHDSSNSTNSNSTNSNSTNSNSTNSNSTNSNSTNLNSTNSNSTNSNSTNSRTRSSAPLDPRLQKQSLEKPNINNYIIPKLSCSSNILSKDPRCTEGKMWVEHVDFKNACDSTSAIEKGGVIYQLTANQNTQKSSNVTPHVIVHDEIFHMLCYNACWILNQKLCLDVSPPVNFGQPVNPMPLNFNNFKHYFDTVMPLLRLEHWHYIYQMTMEEGERNKPVVLNLSYDRREGLFAYLGIEYTPESGNDSITFRVEDFCILELTTIDDSNIFYLKSCFGFVQSINGGIITVMINNFDKKIIRKQLTIKICANIGNCLKQIKTLKYLQFSPLCEYVLKPCTLTNTTPIKCVTVRNTPLLNDLQKQISGEASEMALGNTPGFYLINGPPGTGKSSVLVSTVLEILHKCKTKGIQPRILLAAPSNAAIDGLIMKLNKSRLELPDRKIMKMVRVGSDKSINGLVDKFTLKFQVKKRLFLENRLNRHPESKNYSQKECDLDPFLRKVLGNQYNYQYRAMEDKILQGANLICTTLSSCTGYTLNRPSRRQNMKYTCCIIDEATQCHEIECLSPIQLGINKFIIAGDPKQLPVVVCNKEALELGFQKSLFARIIENVENTYRRSRRYQTQRFPMKTLSEQYRMRPEICDYPNKTFYDGTIKSRPRIPNIIKPTLKPYLIFNLKTKDEQDSDMVNSREVDLILNLLRTLKNCIMPCCKFSIGIITPYNVQMEIIRQRVKCIRFNPNVTITVNTVNSFQRTENDVIIISCAKYNSNYFLSSLNRLNVALTRGRQALYIIGSCSLFEAWAQGLEDYFLCFYLYKEYLQFVVKLLY